MLDRYHVTGIIQLRVHGEWSELALSIKVRAESRQAAIDKVLAGVLATTLEDDPFATARWNTPELVQAASVQEGAIR